MKITKTYHTARIDWDEENEQYVVSVYVGGEDAYTVSDWFDIKAEAETEVNRIAKEGYSFTHHWA